MRRKGAQGGDRRCSQVVVIGGTGGALAGLGSPPQAWHSGLAKLALTTMAWKAQKLRTNVVPVGSPSLGCNPGQEEEVPDLATEATVPLPVNTPDSSWRLPATEWKPSISLTCCPQENGHSQVAGGYCAPHPRPASGCALSRTYEGLPGGLRSCAGSSAPEALWEAAEQLGQSSTPTQCRVLLLVPGPPLLLPSRAPRAHEPHWVPRAWHCPRWVTNGSVSPVSAISFPLPWFWPHLPDTTLHLKGFPLGNIALFIIYFCLLLGAFKKK